MNSDDMREMRLHLGCGENYREGWTNVDCVKSVNPDQVVNLDETPWPWKDGSIAKIYASHVFEHLESVEDALRECARILIPNGVLVVELPIGVNAVADPDHEHVLTWRTPDYYCGERHWDTDVGLTVMEKSVSLTSHYRRSSLRALQRLKWWFEKKQNGYGEWCFNQPAMSGEFTVVFKKRWR